MCQVLTTMLRLNVWTSLVSTRLIKNSFKVKETTVRFKRGYGASFYISTAIVCKETPAKEVQWHKETK